MSESKAIPPIDVERIRQALGREISEEQAQAIARYIAETGGVERAAAIFEQLRGEAAA